MKKNHIPESSPQLLGVAEAAKQLGISVWTLRRWAYRGEIESVKLGGKLLMVPATELQRIVDDGTRPRLVRQ